jgi:RHS repeat-associated protein
MIKLEKIGAAHLMLQALAMVAAATIPFASFGAVGRTSGSFDVSSTGAAVYQIPIFTPPGTAGMTPSLSLVYDHHSSNTLFGVGWNISGLSAIARCPRTWVQDGDARDIRNDLTDRFCLDGNRLRLFSGTYGVAGSVYRTELETFARITASGAAGNGPASFTVEQKDGLIYEYGTTTDSRIESIGQSTARAWAVSKIRDRSGNAIDFTYTEDTTNGSYRISSIQYTSNSGQGLTAAYAVNFTYETKPSNEIDTGYVAGSLIKEITRLDRIDVNYSSVLVRRYELTYEGALSSTSRSRLASVQECTGSPLDCLAATTFSYQNGTNGLSSEVNTGATATVAHMPLDVNGDGREDLVYPSSLTSGAGHWMVMFANTSGGYNAPINTGVVNTNSGGAIPIDYNADGFEDLLVPYSGGTWWVMLGNASGLAAPVNTGTPTTATGTGSNARAMDMNGDGLHDLVWADLIGPAGGDAIRYRLRVWGGTFSSTVTTLVAPLPVDDWIFGSLYPGSMYRLRKPLDFNGDGRDDLVFQKIHREWNWEIENYIVTRTLEVICAGGETFSWSLTPSDGDPMYGDFNGDGKSDLLYIETSLSSWYYSFSKGTSFGSLLTLSAMGSYNPARRVIVDWDGDGNDDVLVPHTSSGIWYLLRSTGETLLAPVSTGLAAPSGFNRALVSDIDGDGQDDLSYLSSGTLHYRKHAGVSPDLLVSATDGFGNGTSFIYVPITQGNYNKHADASFPEQDYRGPLYVVANATTANGIGGSYTLSYWYYGARRHLQGRGFEGFYGRRTHDSRNGLVRYDYFNRLFPYTATPFQVDLFQPSDSALIRRVSNTWNAHAYSSGSESRSLPYLEQSTSTTYEVGGAFNGSLISTAVTTNAVDSATGTLNDSTTTTTEAATANGVEAGAQYVQRTWHSALFTDETNWCIGRPSITQFINSHNLTYGEQISRRADTTWNATHCRPTQTQVQPGNLQYQVTTALGYDGFGNLNSQTVTGIGMSGRTTTTGWGTTGQFPHTVTNPLSQTTTNGWDFALGVQTSQTDPNGIAVSWQYDGFGRKTRETRADGTANTWVYNDCSAVGCVSSLNKMTVVEYALNADSSTLTDRWVYLDRFDRPLVTSQRLLGGAYDRNETQYDSLGRVVQQSAPCMWSGCASYWTSFTYDVLNRVTQTQRPISATNGTLQTTTVQYAGLTSTVTDPQGKQTIKVATVTGGPGRSQDHNSYYQNFAYDAFGSLRSVTDGLSNTLLTATYDYGLQPFQRTVTDANLGALTNTFNALGELTSYTDAKSQNFSITYDALSRPLTRTEPDLTTSWTWGSSAGSFNIGQLQSVSAGAYQESFTYDNKARLVSRNVTIPSDATYTYDFAYHSTTGLLDSLTYPVSTSSYRLKLKYAYQYGALQSISDFNAPSTVFWLANATNARSQVTQETLGNGVITQRSFDAVTGWMNSLQSGLGGGSALQNESYLFDLAGNVLQRQNNNVGLTENFYYDNLYRLDYSTLGAVTNLDLSYDATGNITSRTDVAGGASWTYHPTKKHAVTQAGSPAYSYTYDANGNATGRHGYTVSWTSYNHPNLIQGAGGESVEFAYNHQHKRWRATLNSSAGIETTYFVGELLEKVVSAGVSDYRHYIFAGGTKVAAYSRTSSGANALRYLREDHQGSISGIQNANGTSFVKESFTAFGNRRNSCTWSGPPTSGQLAKMKSVSRRGYTWHTALGDMGLNDMNGRIQDAVTGRFLSPDPFVDGSFGTQGFNRYSYVGNNPLSFSDPTGFAGYRGSDKMQDGGGFDSGDLREARAQAAAVARGQQVVTGPRTSSTPNFTSGMQFANGVLSGFRGADGSVVLQTAYDGFRPSQKPSSPTSNSPTHSVGVECDDPGQCVDNPVEKKYPGLPRGVRPGQEPGLGKPDADLFALVVGGGVKATVQIGSAVVWVSVKGFGRLTGREAATGAAAAATDVAGNGSGVTVLGSYPNYVQMGEQMGANFFSIPAEKWAQMTVAEQWVANRAFLDAAIARGDRFVFSDSFAAAGSFFERELLYLQKQRVFLGVPGM